MRELFSKAICLMRYVQNSDREIGDWALDEKELCVDWVTDAGASVVTARSGCAGCDRCDPAVCPDAKENAPPASWQEMVMRLANEENELGAKRQAAYGKDNIPEMGEHGLLVRVVDCVARLRHLVYDPVSGDVVAGQFDDAKVEDVLIDIANFARYWRAYRRGWWTVDACPPLLSPH